MNRIFLISNLKSLERGGCSTSSELFVLDLINELSSKHLIYVISNKKTVSQTLGNITLLQGPINAKKHLYDAIQKLFTINSDDLFIIFGYDYFLFLQLNKLRNKYKCKFISFVFDHHKPALEKLNIIKKFLLLIYFNLGIKKINSYNGVILFNQQAIKKLKIKTPNILLNPFVNKSIVNVNDNSRIKTFLFAGTLNKYNCIKELITLFKNNPSLTLYMCGYGNLSQHVIDASNRYSNIKYLGTLNSFELETHFKNVDCLICLRKKDNLINKISFPSKIIEYAYYSKPIFSNNFSDLVKNFKPFIWTSNSTKTIDLQNALNEITSFDFNKNNKEFTNQQHNFLSRFDKNIFAKSFESFIKKIR